MVLVILSLVVLMGCAALAVDTGRVHNEQIKVQNAADMAALAAVTKIPNSRKITETAVEYANMNCDGLDVQVEFNGTDIVTVTCTKEVSYTFGKVIGFQSTTVTATGKAKKAIINSGGSGGGSDSGSIPPCADCYPNTTAKINQTPATGFPYYVIGIQTRHEARPAHTSGHQALVLAFNQPVTYSRSNGTITAGDGTPIIRIDYTYWQNANDNIGLGDVYLYSETNTGLALTGAIMLCENGASWSYMPGDEEGSGIEGGVLIN
ncbi:MAG: hypothetical protein HUJ69_09880 [Lachnospiraceae bacterium]|nr:hypothetical protein [Lachnospiraceae bacterium]